MDPTAAARRIERPGQTGAPGTASRPAQGHDTTRTGNTTVKLVCHIGTPKTASTFLQNTCALNGLWLARHGVIYPDLLAPDANHITLFYAAAQGIHDFARDYGLHTPADVAAFRTRLNDTIARQIAEAPPGAHTMVMSSENLSGNIQTIPGIQRLADLLRPHFSDIRIVIYLRRQDDAILSMYGEFMRRGFSARTFDQFLDRVLGANTHTPYLYYRRLLQIWAGVFGAEALDVRLFDRTHFPDGDILADFMACVFGADNLPDLDRMERSGQGNVSLSAPVLEFLRRIQPEVPFIKDKISNPARAALAPRIDALPADPRPRLSHAQSNRIMTHFQGANSWLKQTYFPAQDGPVFAPRDHLPEQGNIGDLTEGDFARFREELGL